MLAPIKGIGLYEAMLGDVHREAAELLLSALYLGRRQDGLRQAFLFGPPGAPLWNRSRSIELSYDRRNMVRTVLYVRQHGPRYLRYMSVRDIWSMLTHFVSENYWHLSNKTVRRFDGSHAEMVSVPTKSLFAEALGASSIFNPRNSLTIYPLVPVRIAADFDSDPFFFVTPTSLTKADRIPPDYPEHLIAPEQFPPFKNEEWKTETPTSWLGVRSPAVQASSKMKAAILGALALTPHPHCRHLFSMRGMFGGRCTFGPSGATSFGDAHTPAMADDIIITEKDHPWLTILASKLLLPEPGVRRQIRALEYYYRAWPLDASERFPWLFMGLDAIFGDAARATQAVIDAIGSHSDGDFGYERLRLLLGLRNSVIHGGAPDVYDSEKYQRYYETYGEDPVHDLELIAARCLRAVIFEMALEEHPHPHAEAIKAYRSGLDPIANQRPAADGT